MIKISHKNIETPIELKEGSPLILSVENQREFYKFVSDLNRAFSEDESEFSFWVDGERFLPDKRGEIVLSPFYFDATDKKIVNLLHKKLQNNFCDGSFIVDFNAINASLELFLDNLCSTVDFAVEYNALTIEDVFKSCGIKPAKTYDSLLEKLVCYVNILIELKSLSFIVLTGFKNVLTADELQAFYKHCELKKVSVLLVEGKVFGEKFPIERRITITEDLCEICDTVDVSY